MDQLSNAYLVRGELKLHFSCKLRRLLLEGDVLSVEEQKRILKGLDYQFVNKDKLLVDACEECEELLVKAGRKYMLALSIDGNDVRALYNWGLALFFLVQLIGYWTSKHPTQCTQIVYIISIEVSSIQCTQFSPQNFRLLSVPVE